MARARKKATRRKTAKAAARKKAATRRKAGKKVVRKKTAGAPGRKRSGTGHDAGVEKRWREYWKCRKQLEESIAAVRQAEDDLAGARALERDHREAFEQTKNALKDLLEVEPASGTQSRALTLMDRDPGASPGPGSAGERRGRDQS